MVCCYFVSHNILLHRWKIWFSFESCGWRCVKNREKCCKLSGLFSFWCILEFSRAHSMFRSSSAKRQRSLVTDRTANENLLGIKTSIRFTYLSNDELHNSQIGVIGISRKIQLNVVLLAFACGFWLSRHQHVSLKLIFIYNDKQVSQSNICTYNHTIGSFTAYNF